MSQLTWNRWALEEKNVAKEKTRSGKAEDVKDEEQAGPRRVFAGGSASIKQILKTIEVISFSSSQVQVLTPP